MRLLLLPELLPLAVAVDVTDIGGVRDVVPCGDDTILDAAGDVGDAGVVATGDVAAGDPPRLRLLFFLFFLTGLRPLAVAVVVVVVADIVGVPDDVPCEDVTVGDITNATTASSSC